MMEIAVVGCGIAGATVSFLLAEQGHRVTLYEQAETCRPVGAGIMIQTSGQQVLQRLGLLEDLLKVSQRLEGMTAELPNGRTLVCLDFARRDPSLFSLGVHRGNLFQLLLERCSRSGVQLKTSFRAVGFQPDQGVLVAANGTEVGGIELLIVADGSRSELRSSLGFRSKTFEYSHGALWATGVCEYQPNRLFQVVEGTQRLVGLLPIGQGRSSYFWGLKVSDWPELAESNFDSWREKAIVLCPQSEPLLRSLHGFHDLTFGSYRSVAVRNMYAGKVALIGDAAHATSPHLGQGANLALEDAECLAACLAQSRATEDALRHYQRLRLRKIRFYRQLTAILSPFFQSDGHWRAVLRNQILPQMPRLPYVGSQMLYTLSGLKNGWFDF